MSVKSMLQKIGVLCVMLLGLFVFGAAHADAADYYVSQSEGNDTNNGTSSLTPWRTLEKAGEMTYTSGDRIFLKCGDLWNEQWTLNGSGTAENPIIVTSYGSGSKPAILRSDTTKDIGILINSAWGWKITGLELGNANKAIYCIVADFGKSYLWFEDLYIHDCSAGPEFKQGDPNRYGISITVNNPADPTAICLQDITVKNCIMERCFFGISTGTSTPDYINRVKNLKNITIQDCVFTDFDGFGFGLGFVDGGSITRNRFLHSGASYIWCGSAAAMLTTCSNIVISDNEFAYTSRIGGSPDGCAIDLEGYDDNITIQNNLFHDNSGAAIMVYDNANAHGGVGVCYNTVIKDNVFYNDLQNFAKYTDPPEIFYQSGGNPTASSFGNVIYTRTGTVFTPAFSGAFRFDSVSIPSAQTWEFNSDGNTEGWSANGSITGLTAQDGYLKGTVTGNDPFIVSEDNLGIDITNNKTLKITLKNTFISNSMIMGVYFTTNDEPAFTAAKSKQITVAANTSEEVEITFDMSGMTSWTGTLKRLRIDPVEMMAGDASNAIGAYGGSASRAQITASDILTNTEEENGTNLALSAITAAASSNGPAAANVKDGSTGTLWTAAGSSNEWVELEFASSITINKLVVQQASSSSINRYVVQYWDGSAWKDAFNGCSAMGRSRQMPIIPVTTRKVRLYVYATESGVPAIEEFSVYNVGRKGNKAWEYDTGTDAEGWTAANHISDVTVSGGYLNGTVTGADPYMTSRDHLALDITNNKTVKIKFKNSTASTIGQFYFITNADGTWNQAKSKTFTINANDPNYTEYTIDMSGVAGWTGTLRRFRFDPESGATGGSFSIDFIRIPGYAKEWQYNTDGNTEGWTASSSVSGLTAVDGAMTGSITGNDPYLVSGDNLAIDITGSTRKLVKIRMKNSTGGTTAKIYFTTTADSTFNETKTKTFKVNANDSNYTEYTIDMSSVAGWTGTLKRLRVDPVDPGTSSGSFSIDFICIN